MEKEIRSMFENEVSYDLSCPVGYSFGEGVKTSRFRNLRFGRDKKDPEEIWQCIDEMRIWFKTHEYECLCVKNASIYFDYKDVTYRLEPCTLRIHDGEMESAANYILSRLKDMGADYGSYYGEFD